MDTLVMLLFLFTGALAIVVTVTVIHLAIELVVILIVVVVVILVDGDIALLIALLFWFALRRELVWLWRNCGAMDVGKDVVGNPRKVNLLCLIPCMNVIVIGLVTSVRESTRTGFHETYRVGSECGILGKGIDPGFGE